MKEKEIMQLKITLFKFKKMAPQRTKFSNKWLQRSIVDDENIKLSETACYLVTFFFVLTNVLRLILIS